MRGYLEYSGGVQYLEKNVSVQFCGEYHEYRGELSSVL